MSEDYKLEEFTEVPTLDRFLAGEPILFPGSQIVIKYDIARCTPDIIVASNEGNFISGFTRARVQDGTSVLFSRFRMRPAVAAVPPIIEEEPKAEPKPAARSSSALPDWMRAFS